VMTAPVFINVAAWADFVEFRYVQYQWRADDPFPLLHHAVHPDRGTLSKFRPEQVGEETVGALAGITALDIRGFFVSEMRGVNAAILTGAGRSFYAGRDVKSAETEDPRVCARDIKAGVVGGISLRDPSHRGGQRPSHGCW